MEEAIQFIRQNKNEPFFLYLAYNMLHMPVSTTEAFLGRSRAGLYGDVREALDWSVEGHPYVSPGVPSDLAAQKREAKRGRRRS